MAIGKTTDPVARTGHPSHFRLHRITLINANDKHIRGASGKVGPALDFYHLGSTFPEADDARYLELTSTSRSCSKLQSSSTSSSISIRGCSGSIRLTR